MNLAFKSYRRALASLRLILSALLLHQMVLCRGLPAVTTGYYDSPSCDGEPSFEVDGVLNTMFPFDLCIQKPQSVTTIGTIVLSLSYKFAQISSSKFSTRFYSDKACGKLISFRDELYDMSCTEEAPGLYRKQGKFDVLPRLFNGVSFISPEFFNSPGFTVAEDSCSPEVVFSGREPVLSDLAYNPQYVNGCLSSRTHRFFDLFAPSTPPISILFSNGVAKRFENSLCSGSGQLIEQKQCLVIGRFRLYIGDHLELNPDLGLTSADIVALIGAAAALLILFTLPFALFRQWLSRNLQTSSQIEATGLNPVEIQQGGLQPLESYNEVKPRSLQSNESSALNRKEVATKPQAPVVVVSETPLLLYDCFLTHNWSEDEMGRNNHETVSKINDALKSKGLKTWFDNDRMNGLILDQMTKGIDQSCVIVAFVTQTYINKVASTDQNDNCKREFTYAANHKSNTFVGVAMEPSTLNPAKWRGPVGAVLGGKLYEANFAFDITAEKTKFKTQVQNLYKQIIRLKRENQAEV